MKAIRIHRFGGPDVMRLDTLTTPEPTKEQALVLVHAASVNPIDYKVRSGFYPGITGADLPVVLGRDLAGRVIAVGEDQHHLKVGDAVFAHLGWDRGGYAEKVLVEPGEWARKPEDLSFARAAGLAQTGDTAWQGLFEHGKLQSGQRVLIQGATGGVGLIAVQLAHQAGAYVVATGSASGQVLLKDLGADETIDYETTCVEDVAKDFDLVLDLVGGNIRLRSWSVLNSDGILVTTLGNVNLEAEARAAGRKGVAFAVQPRADDLAEMAKRASRGNLRIDIAATYPLHDAAAALTRLETARPKGKIILTFE
jgi:NADPH:quinone reductase-like Zn-dependent oxidoreductase